MIRRLQPNYKGGIGVIYSKESHKERTRYCSRCENLFQVQSILGSRILGVGESKQPDYDLWLQCGNCGSIYRKNEVKVEPDLESIKVPSYGRQGRQIRAVEGKKIDKKKRGRGRGNNPRHGNSKYEINDEELQGELRQGAQLISYYTNEPLK